jgi:hypothetical protein
MHWHGTQLNWREEGQSSGRHWHYAPKDWRMDWHGDLTELAGLLVYAPAAQLAMQTDPTGKKPLLGGQSAAC